MPQTLLLADDSVTIQRVIELTFADEDINVVAVSDGDQAIARLDSMPPDIVLVDVGMPGKSGYDVAGHMKQTPHLSRIPVVLLTGAFEPVDEVKANALGCDGVLAKPFEPQTVISRVKELLARAAAEAPQPTPQGALAAFAPEMKTEVAMVAAAPAPHADATAKLDEYFDQLDSAFARFTSGQQVKPADISPAVAADATPAGLDWFGPPLASDPAGLDPSLSLQAPPMRALSSLSSGLELPDSAELVREVHALQPPVMPDRVEPSLRREPVESPTPVEAREPAAYTQAAAVSEPVAQAVAIGAGEPMVVAPVVPAVPRELPALGDAFAAIPTAEQADPGASSAWPSPAPAAAAPAVTDELIDRISRRVIEQLTDRVVREAVADAVSGIAERLVRDEIDRIKKSIE